MAILQRLLAPHSLFRAVTRVNSAACYAPFRQFSTGDEAPFWDKILIANRGEIACRIMRTANRMGIKTVAVYSDADAAANHVKMADEAVNIGPAPSAQSYLKVDKIVQACLDTGAKAVHPGYGFLSENPHLAQALEKHGIAWIGPNEHAIEAMGDKIASKKLAHAAKVNTVPGVLAVIQGDEEVKKVCADIGYPVMIKASAGGGGKGMRIAWNDQEALEGFRLSREEAISSFGDDRLFIEKFIEDPRHIEFQIIGDSFGNVVYLPERECSVQRRNQKVVEESPSPAMDEELRKKMGEQAVALAKAVNYDSAGTVEFLVDKHKNFFFLEMNTRLQVEHPITECVTGLDLVEQMFRAAAKKHISVEQKDISINGWAVEARVYAEDPLRNYLPSIGRLQRYREPESTDLGRVRCDSGISEWSEISVHYDPMISKLVTHSPDRDTALKAMCAALDSYVISGVNHNVSLLRAICAHPRFVAGDFSTKFLEEEYPNGFFVKLSATEEKELLAVAAVMRLSEAQHTASAATSTGFEFPSEVNYVAVLGEGTDDERAIALSVSDNFGSYLVSFDTADDSEMEAVEVASNYQHGDDVMEAEVDGVSVISQKMGETQTGLNVQYKGFQTEVGLYSPAEFALRSYMPVVVKPDYSKMTLSPMPGVVVSVNVEVGDVVSPGAELAVVEAMKMQNILRAGDGGVVKAIRVKKGQNVAVDEILIEFE